MVLPQESFHVFGDVENFSLAMSLDPKAVHHVGFYANGMAVVLIARLHLAIAVMLLRKAA